MMASFKVKYVLTCIHSFYLQAYMLRLEPTSISLSVPSKRTFTL